MCLKKNRKREIIKNYYVNCKFRSLWLANHDFEKFSLAHYKIRLALASKNSRSLSLALSVTPRSSKEYITVSKNLARENYIKMACFHQSTLAFHHHCKLSPHLVYCTMWTGSQWPVHLTLKSRAVQRHVTVWIIRKALTTRIWGVTWCVRYVYQVHSRAVIFLSSFNNCCLWRPSSSCYPPSFYSTSTTMYERLNEHSDLHGSSELFHFVAHIHQNNAQCNNDYCFEV